MVQKRSLVPLEHIERSIYLIRGQRVMLDADLAEIYGVATKVLNQVVKRGRCTNRELDNLGRVAAV